MRITPRRFQLTARRDFITASPKAVEQLVMRTRSSRGRSAGQRRGPSRSLEPGQTRMRIELSGNLPSFPSTPTDYDPDLQALVSYLSPPTPWGRTTSAPNTYSSEVLTSPSSLRGRLGTTLLLGVLLFLCGLWTGCSLGSASVPTRVPPEPSTSTSGSTKGPSSTEPTKPQRAPKSGLGKDNWTPSPSINLDCPRGSPCRQWVPA